MIGYTTRRGTIRHRVIGGVAEGWKPGNVPAQSLQVVKEGGTARLFGVNVQKPATLERLCSLDPAQSPE
ncbi:hypothetical protein ABZ471_45680 [Streptomyces sp. NPDC005728]|uniref:hypothetical protein n=1 Tax=Streptomyces sp. NPDC005728 TaxID=3157054 RepID=UPI003406E05D